MTYGMKMRDIAGILVAVVTALWLACCGGPESFKITGELTDGATLNLYVKYYGAGAVRTGVTAAREGKFEAEFSSSTPTIVELLDNDYNVLARMYLQNGDEMNITVNRANPTASRVTGNEISERWSALINEHSETLSSGDHEKINTVIEDYITANPSDPVGALMFAEFYDSSSDPVHAMEVMEMIDMEARPVGVLDPVATIVSRFADPDAYGKVSPIKYRLAANDSTITFSPKDKPVSLISLSDENSKRTDSIVPHLKKIAKDFPEKKLQVIDFVLYADTGAFKRVTYRDSATWVQGWLPGGILGKGIAELAVPAMPYFIVTDSAGTQLYRGTSATEASDRIKEALEGGKGL